MPHFNLDNIFDLEHWQDLQDSLADTIQLAISTIDYKGNPISTHSNCTPFCKKIRAHADLAKMCQKCDSRAGLEAVRYNKPYIYLCHYNIIAIAIPITSDNKYIGAIIAGQVMPIFSGPIPDLEQILYSPNSLHSLYESQELNRLYKEIPTLDYGLILRASNLLFKLCNYIMKEAADKNRLENNMYHSLAMMQDAALPSLPNSNHISLLDSQLTNMLSPGDTSMLPFSKPKNRSLLPALEYIYENAHLMVSMEKSTLLCHLSSSYFSRSFTKEFGKTYTVYMVNLKIKWAKDLLTNTDLPIMQVSNQLGFSDPGYFTKTFKKYEYLTPSMYRKYAPSGQL